MAVLQSRLFTEEPAVRTRLQACADDHAKNIHQQKDFTGDFVGNIQIALTTILGPGHGIGQAELDASTFGETTGNAVFRFKNEPALNGTTKKILGGGQLKPDRIVGRQTIEALDKQFKKRETPGGPPPNLPTVTREQDVFVQILGFSPLDPLAGKPTTREEPGLAPSAADLATQINTSGYLNGHLPVAALSFNGGGGQAKPASDPTDAIVVAVTAARAAATAAGSKPGKVCVVGFSIGGRNAATVCRKLVAAGIPVTYLGLADAAFDNETDAARTTPVVAGVAENFFESVHHFVRGKFPEFEFHGPVPGCLDTPFDGLKFFKDEKADAEPKFNDAFLDRTKKKIAIAHFDKVHGQAVRDSYPLVLLHAKEKLAAA